MTNRNETNADGTVRSISRLSDAQLVAFDFIVVNSSAGKDSVVTLDKVVKRVERAGGDLGRVIVVHADLGRVEWQGTKELAARQAARYGLRFETVTRPQGDLIDQVKDRGMWPSSSARYCTSDHKRDQVRKVIVELGREAKRAGKSSITVLNCSGIRAAESSNRAKLADVSINKRYSTKSRDVVDWLPIFDMSDAEVWSHIDEHDLEMHKAYKAGMSRLSCCFCIMASKRDLIIAGRLNRDLLDTYVETEQEIGHKFKADMSIESLRDMIDNSADDIDLACTSSPARACGM